jgi:hypothetical protein
MLLPAYMRCIQTNPALAKEADKWLKVYMHITFYTDIYFIRSGAVLIIPYLIIVKSISENTPKGSVFDPWKFLYSFARTHRNDTRVIKQEINVYQKNTYHNQRFAPFK